MLDPNNIINIETDSIDWSPKELDPLGALSNSLEDSIQIALKFNDDGSVSSADVVGMDFGNFEKAAKDAIEQTLNDGDTTEAELGSAAAEAVNNLFGNITRGIGAFTNFGKFPSQLEKVEPKLIKCSVSPPNVVSFSLEGINDMHETAKGELAREEVYEKLISDKDGNFSVSLLPGTYLLKQTSAPEGYVVNEQLYQIQVGSGGFIVDGDETADACKVQLAKLARKYVLTVRDYGKNPISNTMFHIVGMTAENTPVRFVAGSMSDEKGRVALSLPLGRFSLYDENPPYAPITSITVASAVEGVIEEEAVMIKPERKSDWTVE
ncbi:MAG: prealbumin-like fold domain-containing protein [Oscillospiraceae bacterium]|jgi:hypothetical protein|nr:prealbumin-like fold domain-containing protein [Oscillospiraceae bacterium]